MIGFFDKTKFVYCSQGILHGYFKDPTLTTLNILTSVYLSIYLLSV